VVDCVLRLCRDEFDGGHDKALSLPAEPHVEQWGFSLGGKSCALALITAH